MKLPLPLMLISGAFGLAIGAGLGVWLTPALPDGVARINTPSIHLSARVAATEAPNSTAASVINTAPKNATDRSLNSAFLDLNANGSTDFAQAWSDASQKTTSFEKRWTRELLISRWAEQDLAAALAFLKSNIKGQEDADAIAALYAIYAQRDLPGAIASLEQWNDHQHRLKAKASILQVMSQSDPFGAVDLWLNTEPRGFSQEVTYAAYQQDASRFLAQIDQLPRDKRAHAMDSLVAAMTQDDPNAALNMALNEGSLDTRQRMLNTIIRKLGEDDPHKALELFNSLPGNTDNIYAIRHVLGNLAGDDPEAALKFVRNTDDINQNSLRTVLNRIAQDDPKYAWSLAMSENKSLQHNSLAINVFNQVLHQDPQLAKSLLSEVEDPNIIEQCRNQLINRLAQEDPQSALDFAYETGLPQLEENAVNAVVNQLAKDDPKLALDFAMSNQDVASEHSIGNALQTWFRTDQEASLNWLKTVPKEDQRANIGATVVQRLTYQDPALAEKIMAEIEIEENKVPNMTRQIAQAYLRLDSQKALEYSLQQSNPALQYEALDSVFTQWRSINKDDAERELLSLNIDDEIRTKLMGKHQ